MERLTLNDPESKSADLVADNIEALKNSSLSYPFGTVHFGRNVLSRVIYGALFADHRSVLRTHSHHRHGDGEHHAGGRYLRHPDLRPAGAQFGPRHKGDRIRGGGAGHRRLDKHSTPSEASDHDHRCRDCKKYFSVKSGTAMHGFIESAAVIDTVLHTDEHRSYQGLTSEHETVKHNFSEYVKEQAHTNAIKSFWAFLKRGYYVNHHKLSKKYLAWYTVGFARRQNIHPMGTKEQMRQIANDLSGQRHRYKDLVA